MLQRQADFGGKVEHPLLFDRAVQLELGTSMRKLVKGKVQELFDRPEGKAYRESKVKTWTVLAKQAKSVIKCKEKDCYGEYRQ